MDKAVLTGQGERSDARPVSATAATAAADSPAVPATADSAAADTAALATAAEGSPATADETVVPGGGPGAVAAAPAAPATEVPARVRAPRWANLPYAIVLAVVAGGLLWVAMGGLRHVQVGMIMVASALLAAAVLRLVLPERAAGLLVARHRVLDVLAMGSLGAGIMATALVLPTP